MNVAVFPVPTYEGVQKVFGEAKAHLGEILSAFEFFDRQSVSLRPGQADGSMISSRDISCTMGKTRNCLMRNRTFTA